jgi:hypothetical protein
MVAGRLGGVPVNGFVSLLLGSMLVWALLAGGSPGAPGIPLTAGAGPDTEAEAGDAFADLPLAFERDAGRQGPRVDFLARTDQGTAFIGAGGATLAIPDGGRTEALRLALAGARPASAHPIERLPGEVNYIVGDRSEHRVGLATFERIRYPGVYPHVAIDWHGAQGQLEYDFRLAPGADPSQIAIRLRGAEHVQVAAHGDLVIDTGGATVRQHAPVAYQRVGGERRPVEAAFDLRGQSLGFELGAYDRSHPLVIDPLVLAYSTYLGGNNIDVAQSVAIDSTGAAYVGGYTNSSDFDTVSQIQTEQPDWDAFVSKLNPAGNGLVYSTYLGGSGGIFRSEYVRGIAVDSSGSAYVAGETSSTNFPTQNPIMGDQPGSDAFVAKLNAAGNALVYSTYLGGTGNDKGFALALDSANAAYVTGETQDGDGTQTGAFPVTGVPLSGRGGVDVFVTKVNAAGSALSYSKVIGGGGGQDNGSSAGWGIAVDSAGAAYVAGETGTRFFPVGNAVHGDLESPGTNTLDAVVFKLNPTASAFDYSTYLGGNATDIAYDVAVDAAGSAYVTGHTASSNFDTLNPIQTDQPTTDAFVSKLSPGGGPLVYSTYLGGNGADQGLGIAVDSAGSAYVVGEDGSTDFLHVDAYEGDTPGSTDAFLSKLNPAGGALTYSTSLGGNGSDNANEVAIDAGNDVYVVGETLSSDFDLVGPIPGETYSNDDAFISKLGFGSDTDGDGVLDDTACEQAEKKLKKAKAKLKRLRAHHAPKKAVKKAKKKVKRAKQKVKAACD